MSLTTTSTRCSRSSCSALSASSASQQRDGRLCAAPSPRSRECRRRHRPRARDAISCSPPSRAATRPEPRASRRAPSSSDARPRAIAPPRRPATIPVPGPPFRAPIDPADEALEDPLALRGGDARTAVLDFQHGFAVSLPTAIGHRRGRRRVLQGVATRLSMTRSISVGVGADEHAGRRRRSACRPVLAREKIDARRDELTEVYDG